MAKRRMFSKTIVQSSRFLKMPVSSRELYFQMGMSADDDGVVEAWNVMKLTNAREDDLRVLVSKGYVQILDNEDLIAYLSDWNKNNKIRKDRYHEGIYKNLKLQILQALEADDNQMTTKCQPSDNQMATEVRLGKDSIGKDSKKIKHKYGEYKNVLLTDGEYQKLQEMFPDLNDRIERLSEYVASTGKSYKSHSATIRAWSRRETKATNTSKPKLTDIDQREYDYDKLEELMRR